LCLTENVKSVVRQKGDAEMLTSPLEEHMNPVQVTSGGVPTPSLGVPSHKTVTPTGKSNRRPLSVVMTDYSLVEKGDKVIIDGDLAIKNNSDKKQDVSAKIVPLEMPAGSSTVKYEGLSPGVTVYMFFGMPLPRKPSKGMVNVMTQV